MRKLLGRSAFAIAACAIIVAPLAARAQDKSEKTFVLKLATVAPDNTPWAEQVNAWKARVEKESKGRVKVKAFLGGTLGDENSTADETRRGGISIWGGSTGALGSIIPELQVLELPYLFRTPEEADYILDEVLYEDLRKLLEQRGFVLAFWAENGYRSFGSKFGHVKTPADLKGRKMRSQPSSVHLETYRALSASPVPIGVTEVLSSLQTGVVDGYDNTPLFAFAASWYQGAKYYTVSDHIYQPGAVLISKKVWDTMPADLHEVLLGDPKAMAREGRKDVRMLAPLLLENFVAAGIDLYRLTEAEKAALAKATLPVHQRFLQSSEGRKAKPLYDKAMKALEEYRKRNK